MAIKPTIYKFTIDLSDLEQHYYDALNLTVALHPSETIERMMARVMAMCLNANQSPTFTKGLDEPDEPDLIVRSMDGLIDLWIDIGEPSTDRIKKASRQAKQLKVYTFNSKSGSWWDQSRNKCSQYKVNIVQFNWPQMQALAALVSRTMQFSMTITGSSAFISAESGDCEIEWIELQT